MHTLTHSTTVMPKNMPNVILKIENISGSMLVMPVYSTDNAMLNVNYFIFIAPILQELDYLSMLSILQEIHPANSAAQFENE